MKQCDNDVFNPTAPTIMHIDLNSCFATIEQQANPLLRGKPVAVAAYVAPGGCILAASVEAKRFGVTTGMRVREGKALCSPLVILPPDPDKYRYVNRKLLALLSEYSSNIEVQSIDEMILNLMQSPSLQRTEVRGWKTEDGMFGIAREIKHRIRQEIGDWLMVSIGIAPNRYLAKIASNLHKPDGLDAITKENIEEILGQLHLEDLCGIKEGYGGRLRQYGLLTPLMLYHASVATLKAAFHSTVGQDWWLWLHGWESDLFDRDETKSIGHSYALKVPYTPQDTRLQQILCQLVEKMGRRLRDGGFFTQGIRISCLMADHTFWNHEEKLARTLFASRDLYEEALRILKYAPKRPVRILAVSCFYLSGDSQEQLSFLESIDRKRRLTTALDTIANRWGEFVVFPGRMLGMEQKVLDRIAFGGVKGLEEWQFQKLQS